MTKILALDSSTDACSVALSLDGIIHSRFELAAKSHTQRLLPLVDELLSEADLKVSQLDAIAFGRGPGSFTGLRICMGVVQGLAFGADLPVVPVSTLASMALSFHQQFPEFNSLVPALDARMDEVYWAIYQVENGLPILVGDESVTPKQLLCDQTAIQSLQGNFAALGQGWHYPELAAIPNQQLLLDIYPNAETIAKIAELYVANGQMQSILDTFPVYLRDSVSWQKRPPARRQIKLDP